MGEKCSSMGLSVYINKVAQSRINPTCLMHSGGKKSLQTPLKILTSFLPFIFYNRCQTHGPRAKCVPPCHWMWPVRASKVRDCMINLIPAIQTKSVWIAFKDTPHSLTPNVFLSTAAELDGSSGSGSDCGSGSNCSIGSYLDFKIAQQPRYFYVDLKSKTYKVTYFPLMQYLQTGKIHLEIAI